MRIMVVQYSGDYLEAYRRQQATKTETYYGHSYVLDTLTRLAHHFGEVAILCCKSPTKHYERLPFGLTLIGAAAYDDAENADVMKMIEDFRPTHLIVQGPLQRVIRWGLRRKCRVMCVLADSFEIGTLRRLRRYGFLSWLLNHPDVEWIGNHGLNACRSLARIGVSRSKIVPWDWVHTRNPKDRKPKLHPGLGPHTLLFVGLVVSNKGVGDAIAAVKALKQRGLPVVLKIAGGGDIERFRQQAAALDVSRSVEFLGIISNAEVVELMTQASLVVVPSWHAYPEGLPLTIYEALSARTPIVASDHPMFAGRLVHRRTAMIHKAGDPDDLADCAEELVSNASLYAAISEASELAWEGLQISTKWGEMLYRWTNDSAEDRAWLKERTLNSQLYDDRSRTTV